MNMSATLRRSGLVVECVWSGYRPEQARVCHRKIHWRSEGEHLRKVSAIKFTDGTTMSVSVRPRNKGEKIEVINGYPRLLEDVCRLGLVGLVHVEDTIKAKDEKGGENNALGK